MFLSGFVVIVVVLSAAWSFAEEAKRAPLGMNLSGVVDWSEEIVFVDVFRAARPWISQAQGKPWGQGGPLALDAKGNVLSLAEGQSAESVVWTGFDQRFPSGRFTCLYEDDGDLEFLQDAKILERSPGKLIVDVQPKHGGAHLKLTRVNPKDPVRNIRLILPGHEKTYREQPFHPDFLARWKGFAAFRFMDWARTNDSKIAEWSDRPTLDMHSQAMRGVAPELMIELANRLEVDAWFCIPHLAKDDYVRQFARLVKEKLDPRRRVYLEYSNECWNGQFGQARYCAEQGKKLGLSENGYEAQLRFYSQRSVEIFDVFAKEFAAPDRLVRVIAVQSANPWTGKTALDWKNAAARCDAVAIAPYFGHRWGNPKQAEIGLAMSLDEFVRELAEDLQESQKSMASYGALAREKKLQLLAYEGGQHLAGHGGAENNERLTERLQAANRHPGMQRLYAQNLRDWNEAGGGLYCVFSSLGRFSKWGSWGVLEHFGQDPAAAPKYQALREYLQGK